ncbi:MAG: PDDEXK nuclease domain-containing protein [Bacteroidales bacterium]|nr:PDDEXK nuclease domain-containing protein [Bacteroidales bacterium]
MNLKKTHIYNLESLIAKIKEIISIARDQVANSVNNELLNTYWEIGHQIVEHEQKGELRAKYGEKLLIELSKQLTKSLGKGYSRSNLQNMRALYTSYPKRQTLSGKLSWSHYCELVSIEDPPKRAFYENETINARWSVRELQRQLDSSLFERLLLSKGSANKEKVMALAKQGHKISSPADMIKDPYVLEFLGIPEEKPFLEKELEKRLIRQIEDFLLELGKGFMYVGSQQRVTLANKHYYVDMVFFNKILKAYVLIDLKTGRLEPDHIGKMNMYLNYYKTEINDKTDNPPIGIILCKDKNNIAAEYALGGINNQLFASKYTFYIPAKEILIDQVRKALTK